MPDAVVIGDWHLASVTAAGLVRLGYRVHGEPGLTGGARAANEPGLAELLTGDAYRPIEDPATAAGEADLAVVAFDSRTEADGTMTDTRPADAVRRVWRASHGRCPTIVSSQVPAGFCDGLLTDLGGDSWLVHIPENLRLGHALEDFLRPSRLVVGCNGTLPAAVAALVERFEVAAPLHMRLVEAELVKHGTNAFLAMCIVFANDLGWIGRDLGADPGRVLAAVQADPRIGDRAPLRPGGAYSGATLQRDVHALSELGGVTGRGTLFEAIGRANAVHALATVAALDRALDGLAGRRVCLLGLTYKPNVSTLRDSPALSLARHLTAQGCQVSAYDPIAERVPDGVVRRSETLAEAVAGTDCTVLMTRHDALRPAELAQTGPRRRLLLATADVPVPPGWTLIDIWRPDG